VQRQGGIPALSPALARRGAFWGSWGASSRASAPLCAPRAGGKGFGSAPPPKDLPLNPSEWTVPDLRGRLKELGVTEHLGKPVSELMKGDLIDAVEDAQGRNGAVKKVVQSSKSAQMVATDVIAELLKAHAAGPEKLAEACRSNVGSFNEEFFMIGGTYLQVAKDEGNVDVVGRLDMCMQTALSEKEKTLRPEIRLLNRLLRADTEAQRMALLREEPETLASDNEYFFGLVKMMEKDVDGQKHNPNRRELVQKLKKIGKEARNVAGGGDLN